MFQKLIVTYYLFISLLLTIMLLLSFILIVSLLRIKPRKQSFSRANIKADFMLLLTANQIKHFFQLNSLKSSGTREQVIHHLQLSKQSWRIASLLQVQTSLILFVVLVSKPKYINFLLAHHLMFLLILQNLFIQMFRVMLFHLLEVINFM